ncbi:hypothetical protein C8R45DRAFT_127256 [Mycena sanguinolenta]|nr:hypothetical protein C8R45DRAFT_127256 [Mycena sanguinolenta]
MDLYILVSASVCSVDRHFPRYRLFLCAAGFLCASPQHIVRGRACCFFCPLLRQPYPARVLFALYCVHPGDLFSTSASAPLFPPTLPTAVAFFSVVFVLICEWCARSPPLRSVTPASVAHDPTVPEFHRPPCLLLCARHTALLRTVLRLPIRARVAHTTLRVYASIPAVPSSLGRSFPEWLS